MIKNRILVLALIVMTAVSFASCNRRSGEVGTKSNPVRLFFMPLKGDAVFKQNAPELISYLEKTTGLSIKPVYSPDFITIIKAFGNNQADVAFMNTLGYIMAHDWAGTEAPLSSVFGDVYKSYRGEFIAKVGGTINSPTDMAGKMVAFADPFSASGYLYALKYLQDHNIKPAKTVFAGSHKRAVEMVYKGEADAAATYHARPSLDGAERDSRSEIVAQYPDVMEKVKIVALTDEIPNGPVAFRKGLTPAAKTKLVSAFIEFSKTPEGRKTLSNLYNITGLALADEGEYKAVQDVLKQLGKTVQEVVPGGITFYNKNIAPLLDY